MIPNDDDITKTQLWKRIDDVIGIIHNVNDQLQPQIVQLPLTIQSQVTAMLNLKESDFQKYQDRLETKIQNFQKELESKQLELLTELKTSFQKYSSDIDERNRDVIAQVQENIQKGIDGYINFVTERLNALSDTSSKNQSANETSIKDYQANLLEKIGLLQSRFEQVMSKLSELSKIVA